MPHASFIHLRVHSSYSLAEGAIKPGQMADLCVRYSMPAVGITDTGNLFGSLEFSKAASSKGVQPIVGCVMSLAMEQTQFAAQVFDKIVLYAKDETGMQNLFKLVSKSFVESEDPLPPHITYAALAEYQEGLIALTASLEGTVGRLLVAGQHKEAEAALLTLKNTFGDRLYIELQRHGLEAQERIEPQLLEFAYKHTIPLVATNDVYFPTKDMYEAHDVLLCIAEGRYVSEQDRRKLTPEHYFKTPEEMLALFADVPEAIANTLVIAKRCATMCNSRKPILPNFSTGEGRDEAEELRQQAREGLQMRLDAQGMTEDEITKPYRERLEFELDVINRMQYPGYFLIVSDFIKWSKRNDIPVGPGRGSGAGSVVAWALEITDLDPLRFGLLFERFLNPERVSMPDFDVDFCQDRRGEVISYVQQKYGHDRVAQIITFGKLQARAVLRDVGRVLQMPYGQVDKICKMVPNNPADPVTLSQAIDLNPDLKRAKAEDTDVEHLIDIALKLEGLNRHASVHAAGVVIGDRPLEQLVALYRDPRSDMPVVQYSMKYAEEAGLVKFDFLGLKTLTVVWRACKLINERKAEGEKIDIATIPLDDPKTFELLSRGDSVGVFQLESAGMRDTLRKLKPDTLEEIIALISLYRPGPMDNIPSYIARKQGTEEPDYLHPKLEGILKETFGVIIYQEQVMQIAQVLSGYTLGGADLLRRAMGKKIKEEMDTQRELFVNGAVANQVDGKQADGIFDLVAKFAGYGFNKSHAAAYALISYQTAWLKANYPVEFYAASMNLDIHDTDKINLFKQDALRSGVELLLPDINQSQAWFSVENGAVRYGLAGLKGVGLTAMEDMVAIRNEGGPFKDIFDFASRADSKITNKRQIESLVKAGAFDSLHTNRRQLVEAVDTVTRYSATIAREKASSQISLFGDAASSEDAPPPPLPEVVDWNGSERLGNELDAVGFYLSAHPLDDYREVLEKAGIVGCAELMEELSDGTSQIRMVGVVTSKRIRVSPKGRFAYVGLSDSSGAYEVAIFDEDLLTGSNDLLEPGTLVSLGVDARKDEGGVRMIATSFSALDDTLANQAQPVTVRINNITALPILKDRIGEEGKGKVPLSLQLTLDDGATITIKLKNRYAITPPVMNDIRALEGVEVL